MAEGLSPIYYKGKITPETKGLGPTYEKDLKFQYMKNKVEQNKKDKKNKKYYPTNYKNLA